MTRIALLFSGLPRLRPPSTEFWQRFADKYSPTIYVHTWAAENNDQQLEKITDLFQPKVMIVDPPIQAQIDLYQGRAPGFVNIYNTLSMWTSIKRAFDALEVDVDHRPDLVVRSRWDFYADQVPALITTPSLVIPMEPYKHPATFHYQQQFLVSQQDVFTYGSYDAVERYCGVIDNLEEVLRGDSTLPFISEYFSVAHLWTQQVGYYTPTMAFTLVR